MKVSELEGPLLDYWVGKALDEDEVDIYPNGCFLWWKNGRPREQWNPSEDWAQGGPIIEDEEIEINVREHRHYTADKQTVWVADWYPLTGKQTMDQSQTGKTALIAAMRAFVASKYGENVPCPDHE